MRRSSALAPLSRDHHLALVVARNLTRATPDTAGSTSEEFLQFLAEHELEHFRLEEALLLPAMPDEEVARELAERVLSDHEHLRDAARRVQGTAHSPPELLRAIGERLRAHVRFEERELFPYLERCLNEQDLAELGDKLAERSQ